MKKFTITLLLSLLMVFGLTLTACNSTDYSSKIESLEERITDLENQNNTLNEINNKLEESNNLLNELLTEQEYEKVSLTVSNYKNYIAFNLSYSDCLCATNEYGYFNLYCMANVSTSRKADCYFENVTIMYQVTVSEWSSSSALVELDYEGNSAGSTFMSKNTTSSTIEFLDSSFYSITVKSISGKVIVPKE